jgi:hypothetical protein
MLRPYIMNTQDILVSTGNGYVSLSVEASPQKYALLNTLLFSRLPTDCPECRLLPFPDLGFLTSLPTWFGLTHPVHPASSQTSLSLHLPCHVKHYFFFQVHRLISHPDSGCPEYAVCPLRVLSFTPFLLVPLSPLHCTFLSHYFIFCTP